MTLEEFNWESPPLSSEDEALIQAYVQTGVPIDSLAYTRTFRELVKRIGCDPNDENELRRVYRRLLSLRKRGVMPRIYAGASFD